MSAQPAPLLAPTIPAGHVDLVTEDGLRYWRVARCPFCDGSHRHGGSLVPPLGSRVAHCTGRSYRLVAR